MVIISQLGVLWEGAHGLLDAQIGHDLFAAAVDACELEALLVAFDVGAHAGPCDGASAEDLACVVANKAGGAGGEQLEQSDVAAQVLILFLVAHLAHLIGDVLKPVLGGLGLCHHVR